MYGYNGRALFVDLTSKSHWTEEITARTFKNFLGGTGLGAYFLYKHCPPGVDPLSPDNPLIFATSPLVGSRLTTSSKFAVVTKSPLTGFIGDSLSSSFMATELKKTGYDVLVLLGRSSHPCLLSITNDEVSFLDGGNLWGLGTRNTESLVKETLGRRTRVACIGPAGENLVRFASITNDGGRQAARTGPGAVMGSKNLKAIAVKGMKEVPVFDADDLNKIGRDLTYKSLGTATEKYREMGTIANVSVFNGLGTLPTRNFQQTTFELSENIDGEQFHRNHDVKTAHCANCTIGCEKIMTTSDNGEKSQTRMEYESAFAMGPLVGISNPNTMIRAVSMCDDYGMDAISTGATISWAMESFEKGLLTADDTGGINLGFGEDDAILTFVEMIASRTGIGKLLGEGSLRASESTGNGSKSWAMQVKGLEMPGYDPRSLKTLALALAVSTRGACHNRSSAYEIDFSSKVDRFKASEERGSMTAESEDYSAILDSLIWCKFLRKAFKDIYVESANIYEKITGWDITPEELRMCGERINNLKKMFNIREGWVREDDSLPDRIFEETLPSGVGEGIGLSLDDLNMMVSSYYKARGWTTKGEIPEQVLERLDLLDLLPEMSQIT